MSTFLNLSNVELIEKSLSKTSLNCLTEKKLNDQEFAWIDSFPENLEFAINISKIYCQKKDVQFERLLKAKFWLEIGGICLNSPIFRILHRVEHEKLSLWQMNAFDELISMKIPICELNDRDIELVCEVSTIEGDLFKGSITLFDEFETLKYGIQPMILGSRHGVEAEKLIQLEQVLYNRRSKEVPSWHVQLMKNRLQEKKVSFCSENPGCYIINFVIPQASHPVRLRLREMDSRVDFCARDIKISREETLLKRKYSKLFLGLSTENISHGDLRALHGIIHRTGGVESIIPAEASNLMWTHREYLCRRLPKALVPFVQSIQWWLVASDPAEIEEALRIIKLWRFPSDEVEREEIGLILLVALTNLKGLVDSPVWIELFERLVPSKKEIRLLNYRSALINFIKRRVEPSLENLSRYLLEEHLFSSVQDNIDEACQLYWRLKNEDDAELLNLYKKTHIYLGVEEEIKKQEGLFSAIEGVLQAAQQQKGNRAIKLEAIKRALSDPESGVPGAARQGPFIPGLVQHGGGTSRNRICALVPDRSNLFKSTAFTVYLAFLRSHEDDDDPTVPLNLPLIFKRDDDLRSDAACLRVFRAIWNLWLSEGSLRLFPKGLLYGVVPLNRRFGIVEFVESVPLSRIVSVEEVEAEEGEEEKTEQAEIDSISTNTHNIRTRNTQWSLCAYLQSLTDPVEANRNFLCSCVGFSLLTYILGIGDRHLDNLLVSSEGHLLHIDFSHVFGADPKPFPPPIKITREMILGFEITTPRPAATNSNEKWNEFKGLCFTALSLLRHKSALILALIESEYQILSTHEGSSDHVKFVQDRLGSLLSQAECLQKFDKLLEESRSAMFPQVMETIHKWAQYWKS